MGAIGHKPCSNRLCSKYRLDGEKYCEICIKTANANLYKGVSKYTPNKENIAFYSSAAWRRLRVIVLNSQPLCQRCSKNNVVSAANVVDHILPWQWGGSKTDKGNLQSLCLSCHSVKTAEDGRNKARILDKIKRPNEGALIL